MILRIYKECYLLEDYDEMEYQMDLEEINNIEYEKNYDYMSHTMDLINCFIEKDCSVLFCIVEKQLKNIDKAEATFIKERTILINREWPYSIEEPSYGLPEIRWYEARDEFELKSLIESEWPFTCSILNTSNDAINIEYVLNVDEFTDFNVLHIIEKSRGKFLERVLPKLKELLDDKLEISDER